MKRKAILLGSTCSLVACFLAQGAWARAEAITAPATGASASEDSASVGEVVVTARRRAEDIQKTPISVSAISHEQIRAAGVRSVQDLTTLVPGVNFTGSGSRVNTVFSIRGLSRGLAVLAAQWQTA